MTVKKTLKLHHILSNFRQNKVNLATAQINDDCYVQ